LFANFCPEPFVTVTYPQFPLVKDIDTPEEESDEEDDDQVFLNFQRSAAPSPEVFKGVDRAVLLKTPTPQASPRQSATRRKKRSTRIPDFAQFIFKITVNQPANTVDIPPRYRGRLVLLVEIKKILTPCQLSDFAAVFQQTDQQARHVFASYPEVNTFGLIIALGDCWTYREYSRKDLRPSPTPSEHRDPTFLDRALQLPPMPSVCQDVNKCFDASGFARLQSSSSDKALAALRPRLQRMSGLTS